MLVSLLVCTGKPCMPSAVAVCVLLLLRPEVTGPALAAQPFLAATVAAALQLPVPLVSNTSMAAVAGVTFDSTTAAGEPDAAHMKALMPGQPRGSGSGPARPGCCLCVLCLQAACKGKHMLNVNSGMELSAFLL